MLGLLFRAGAPGPAEHGMLLDLRGFLGEAEHVSRTFSPAEFPLPGEEFRVVASVGLEASVRKDARKVRLVGRLVTTIETDCGRCLEAFTIAVDSTFDLLFLPAGDPPAAEQDMQDADMGVSFYENESIDLGEVIREQFFLALPMKPLCGADCRGLCPSCGSNRNREVCTCRTDWVDPRLEGLRKLIDR